MRIACTCILAHVIAMFLCGTGHAQERLPGNAPMTFKEHLFKASNGQSLRYSLFTPGDVPPGQRLPLVVCLHGAGGGTHAANVLSDPGHQKKRPCFNSPLRLEAAEALLIWCRLWGMRNQVWESFLGQNRRRPIQD